MKSHPYLRAYMAGAAVPTMLMLIVLSAYCIIRFVYKAPVPLERMLVFPMAVVPNLFGVWNILYVARPPESRLPIGLHGALLPFILAPLGFLLARSLDLLTLTSIDMVWFGTIHIPYIVGLIFFPIAVTVYYLLWKHFVSFLNALLGVA